MTDEPSPPELVAQDGVGVRDRLARLWTPHRMAYIKEEAEAGERHGDECPFCRIPKLDDAEGLILFRGPTAYAVLNLHPYNPGHLMVVPYRHVAALDGLTEPELLEIATLTRDAVAAIRSVSSPHGFNIGLNLGLSLIHI